MLTGLPGCDPVYGIYARQIALEAPDEDCIVTALRKTPGVTDVQVKTITSEGWLLVGEGPRHGSPIHYFTYEVGRTYAPTLMVEDFGDGKFEYSDTMLRMGEKIPQPDIDYTLPIMRDVERRVAHLCGIQIGSGMIHHCIGARCDLEDSVPKRSAP